MTNYKITKRKFTSEEIIQAYRKHKNVLVAQEIPNCCGRGSEIRVMNDAVLLRRMLISLGFTEQEVQDTF